MVRFAEETTYYSHKKASKDSLCIT